MEVGENMYITTTPIYIFHCSEKDSQFYQGNTNTSETKNLLCTKNISVVLLTYVEGLVDKLFFLCQTLYFNLQKVEAFSHMRS